MSRGQYDRSSFKRASEYEHNRDPDYVAWRAGRFRENCAVRKVRALRPDRQHQIAAIETVITEEISETIGRMRAEIIAELKAERGRGWPLAATPTSASCSL